MKKMSPHPTRGRPVRDLLVILGVSLLTLVIFVGTTELYLRITVPFITTNWPGRFDPRFGTTLQPGETLQRTNGVDYWTRTRVNALGFLDREPPAAGSHSGCRVLFIGDSFVEAAQVPIDRKFQVIFERLAKGQLPELGVETLAFSHSGTGQANQLAYYEFFGKSLQPDVVVLVVASNDFSNNSPLLDGMRYGWHPLHLPRLFFAVAPNGQQIIRQPVDPDWRHYQLAHARATRPLHRYIHKHSYFYNWMFTHLQANFPALAALLSGDTGSDVLAGHMHDIENIPGFSQAFADWNYPDDLKMDTMFFAADPLPPVFEQALRLTGHALDEFQHHARDDGFNLLLLAEYEVTRDYAPGTVKKGRTLDGRGYLQRLATLATARDIPLIDQNRYILAKGGNIEDAHFERDGHWSEQGHVWAAEALLEYFHQHPQVCSKQTDMQPGE